MHTLFLPVSTETFFTPLPTWPRCSIPKVHHALATTIQLISSASTDNGLSLTNSISPLNKMYTRECPTRAAITVCVI